MLHTDKKGNFLYVYMNNVVFCFLFIFSFFIFIFFFYIRVGQEIVSIEIFCLRIYYRNFMKEG